MTHMKVEELVVAAYATAPDLLPEKAELMRDIASRLDIMFIALAEAIDQNTAQAAVLAGLNGVNNHG